MWGGHEQLYIGTEHNHPRLRKYCLAFFEVLIILQGTLKWWMKEVFTSRPLLVWLLVQSMPTALRTNLKGNEAPCGEMCGKQPPLLTPCSWFFSFSSFYQDSSSPAMLSSQLFIISTSTLTFALFIWEWVCSGRKFHTHPSLLSPPAASFAVFEG